jgi:benzoyl-CoA 2,3-dioxygenase component B
MGPDGRRTSTSTCAPRSASTRRLGHFDYVKMPDYRWGIFLNPAEEGRKVNFGAHKGEPPGRKSRANTAATCAA